MIANAVQARAPQDGSALDGEAIFARFDVGSKGSQHGHSRCHPVRFLDAELRGIAHLRASGGDSGGDGDDGKLVDGAGD